MARPRVWLVRAVASGADQRFQTSRRNIQCSGAGSRLRRACSSEVRQWRTKAGSGCEGWIGGAKVVLGCCLTDGCHCEACSAGRGNLNRPGRVDCFASLAMTTHQITFDKTIVPVFSQDQASGVSILTARILPILSTGYDKGASRRNIIEPADQLHALLRAHPG